MHIGTKYFEEVGKILFCLGLLTGKRKSVNNYIWSVDIVHKIIAFHGFSFWGKKNCCYKSSFHGVKFSKEPSIHNWDQISRRLKLWHRNKWPDVQKALNIRLWAFIKIWPVFKSINGSWALWKNLDPMLGVELALKKKVWVWDCFGGGIVFCFGCVLFCLAFFFFLLFFKRKLILHVIKLFIGFVELFTSKHIFQFCHPNSPVASKQYWCA